MTLLVGGIGVLALALFAVDRLAVRVVRPPRRLPERPIETSGLPYRELTVSSRSGNRTAWILPGTPIPSRGPSGAARDAEHGPVVLLVHGWGAHHGTMLLLAEQLQPRGLDALLYEVRGHGASERRPWVTIRDFRDDVADLVAWARGALPGRRLVLLGHSMGGAAAVLAAADGSDVDALVLVAAPHCVIQVTSEFLTASGMPGAFLTTALKPFWWPRVGGSFLPLTPSRRIAEVEVPILMIQPEHDGRVDRRHADRLAAEAGLSYHLIAGREHTDVLSAPETADLVESFVRGLPGPAPDECSSG